MPKVYKMIDRTDKFTKEFSNGIPSMPFRVLAVGKTGSGKSSVAIGNLLLRKDFYRDCFLPENIFIFTGSRGDPKIRTIAKELDIDKSQIIEGYDEEKAKAIYEMIVDEYNKAIDEGRQPEHFLYIFDDLSYTNFFARTKKNSIIDKIFANGRKYLISCITVGQKFSSLNTQLRENTSTAILFSCSNKQLDLIEQDYNYLPTKKAFFQMFRDHTSDSRHDFIVIDFSQKHQDDIYRNMDFKKICACKYKNIKKMCDGIEKN